MTQVLVFPIFGLRVSMADSLIIGFVFASTGNRCASGEGDHLSTPAVCGSITVR